MRAWTDPVVATHLLFVLNAVLWAVVGAPDCAIILGMSTVASCAYHRYAENDGFWALSDQILAVTALGVTLGRVLPNATALDILNGFVLLGAALLAKVYAHRSGEYDAWHTVWHGMVFVGQMYLIALFNASNYLSLPG